MPNNKLVLRSVNSPWVLPVSDLTTGSVLSWADVDNNFIYLKGYDIYSGSTSGTTLILDRINGDALELDLSSIVNAGDTYTTGSTLIGDVVYFDRTDVLSAYSVNLSGITGGGSFTGNTSASCISDLWVSNVHGCSPIIIHDSIQTISSTASGALSFAFGNSNIASGQNSHAEGQQTTALGNESHSEGTFTTAIGNSSHAEGDITTANGTSSHAEGLLTKAIGNYSHAEGVSTIASGQSSHAEGAVTRAIGARSHAEGQQTTAIGNNSHAEGQGTKAYNIGHAEGYQTIASGVVTSHAEGWGTIASGQASHAEGQFTIAGFNAAHAEGANTTAIGGGSHAEGGATVAIGGSSHAEGQYTTAIGDYSHAEGSGTTAGNYAAHAEGQQTTANGQYSHAEGQKTFTSTFGAHAEGYLSRATGDYSHAEGIASRAIGQGSHAEGGFFVGPFAYSGGTAFGAGSHAEGQDTTAFGVTSHAEGTSTTANGNYSHAGGFNSSASGSYAFVHGNTSTATNGAIVLGNSLNGTVANTVYVSQLNINSVGAGPGVTDIGVDGSGNVVNQASDERLKENINTIENALDKVNALRGVTYNWKDKESGGDGLRYGFIAQEVNSVIPELTFTNGDNGYMGVQYKEVTSLLVESIKEQQKIINELKEELVTLRNKITILENK